MTLTLKKSERQIMFGNISEALCNILSIDENSLSLDPLMGENDEFRFITIGEGNSKTFMLLANYLNKLNISLHNIKFTNFITTAYISEENIMKLVTFLKIEGLYENTDY